MLKVLKTNVVKPVSQEELRELRTRYFTNKKTNDPNEGNKQKALGTFFPSAQLDERNMRVTYRVKCNGKSAGSITISSDAQTDLLKQHTNGRLETTSGSDTMINTGPWQQQKTCPSKAVVCPMTGKQRVSDPETNSIVTISSTDSTRQERIEVEDNSDVMPSTSSQNNAIDYAPDHKLWYYKNIIIHCIIYICYS